MELRTILAEMDARNATDLHLAVGVPPILRIQGDLLPLVKNDSPWELLVENDLTSLTDQLEELSADRNRRVRSNPRRWFFLLDKKAYDAQESSAIGSPVFCVRRLLPRVPTLMELSLPAALTDLTQVRRGLVIIAGPTGCGKQTTACAMIEHINTNRHDAQRIMTVEDGPGYLLASKMSLVTQHLVGIDCETMADGIAQVQAMDPDIVFLGEVMDEESILGGLRLADRGHLVITTLHADGVADAIGTLYDLAPTHSGLVRRQLSRCLVAVVGQRLLPRSFEKGRVSVQEILLNNDHVRERLARGDTDLTDLIESGRGEGMQTFDDAFLDLLARGAISYQVARDNLRDLRRLPEPP